MSCKIAREVVKYVILVLSLFKWKKGQSNKGERV